MNEPSYGQMFKTFSDALCSFETQTQYFALRYNKNLIVEKDRQDLMDKRLEVLKLYNDVLTKLQYEKTKVVEKQ